MLAARSGGLPETVIDGTTGFLHTPDDPEDLADSILRMEQCDKGQRRAMGIAGRKWLEQHGSMESWTDEFNKVIESLPKSELSTDE